MQPRICVVCGKPKGTACFSLPLKWVRESNPELVPFDGDYAHPKCLRDVRAKARQPKTWEA